MSIEWVVLLEVGAAEGSEEFTLPDLRRLVAQLGSEHSAALHHPQRYAIQFQIGGDRPDSALAAAVAGWRRALRSLQLPEGQVVRAEVMTPEEFEQDLRSDEGVAAQPAPAAPTPMAGAAPISGATGDDPEAATGLDLLRAAFSDPVTGLAGRARFSEELRLAAERAGRSGPAAVVLFDLWRFREVGHRFGFAFADQVLVDVGQRLRRSVPPGALVARLGDDRFGMLLPGRRTEAAQVARAALDDLQAPLAAGDEVVHLAASAGVADTDQSRDPDVLLRVATAALEGARAAGGDHVRSADGPACSQAQEAWPDPAAAPDRLSLLMLLQRSARLAATCQTLGEACRTVLEDVCRHFGWSLGHLLVPDGRGDRMVPSGVQHVAPGPAAVLARAVAARTLGHGEGLAGKVLATGRPAWTLDLGPGSAPGAVPPAPEAALRCALAVPVPLGDEVVAVLEFAGDRPAPPDEALVEVLVAVGQQLARIVERARAERSRVCAELRFRALVDASADAVVLCDENQAIVGWNGAAARVFGYGDDEILGRPLSLLVTPGPEHPPEVPVPGAPDGAGMVLTGARRDGTPFPIEVRISSAPGGSGACLTAVLRDLSAGTAGGARPAPGTQEPAGAPAEPAGLPHLAVPAPALAEGGDQG